MVTLRATRSKDTLAPSSATSSSITETSRMSGRLAISTGESASRDAAIMGSAAFLLPGL